MTRPRLASALPFVSRVMFVVLVVGGVVALLSGALGTAFGLLAIAVVIHVGEEVATWVERDRVGQDRSQRR